MTPRRPLTDSEVRLMLLARAAAPMPRDLPDLVLAGVADARNGRRPATRSRRSREPELLIAAVLVIGGTLLAVGIATRPKLVAVASPTPSATASSASSPPAPSLLATSGPTLLGAHCFAFDVAAQNGHVDAGTPPVPGAGHVTSRNGPVLVLDGTTTSPGTFDPFAATPQVTDVATWGLSSFAVNGWAVSSDGTVVAAALGDKDCPGEVWVVRRDGTGLRRTFTSADASYGSPVWSPTGGRLAVVRWQGMTGRPTVPIGADVELWDSTASAIVDLGRTCETCAPTGALAWSPDGTQLAVPISGTGCPDGYVATPECFGIALVNEKARWNIAVRTGTDAFDVLGWLDASHVLVIGPGGLERADLVAGTIEAIDVSTPLWTIGLPAVSPDHSKVALMSNGPTVALVTVEVATGQVTQIGGIPSDVLDLAWSPDSRWVLLQATDSSGNARGMYLAPADGSAPGRLVLRGGFGVMTWLTAP
jgi:hypothetical protein